MRMRLALAPVVLFGSILSTAGAECLLSERGPAKPEASLTQCFQFNEKACCLPAHDAVIERAFRDLVAAPCRPLFPLLRSYFCLGCSPDQEAFTTNSTATIRVCRDFADSLVGSGDGFRECGLQLAGQGREGVVVRFDSQAAFFQSVKPPFFRDFTIELVSSGPCLTSPAARVGAAPVLTAVGALLGLWANAPWRQ